MKTRRRGGLSNYFGADEKDYENGIPVVVRGVSGEVSDNSTSRT